MDQKEVMYQATLAYLYERLPMFSRQGASAYKKDLYNTLALCEVLDQPQKKFPSIHIAGTNGKGSVSHMLAAALQQQGYRTGLYTSPHLKDFRERIRINGIPVSGAFVTELVDRLKDWTERIQPSFFEMTVALAFAYFAEQKVDIAVVETGLGGKLDSTNILMPVLSIITNISLDHQYLLGESLEEIAAQKAGIIKSGIPVVIGEHQAITDPVFLRQAADLKSQLCFAQDRSRVLKARIGQDAQVLVLGFPGNQAPESFRLDLSGQYQGKNLVTLYASMECLGSQGWPVSPANLKEALSRVRSLTGLRGRWELVSREPLVVMDVAHNEGGLKEVFAQVARQSFRNLHVVLGFARDKDIPRIMELFPTQASYYYCHADIPRALPAGSLRLLGEARGLKGKEFPSVRMAYQEALDRADPRDMILVCGSFFIVGELLPEES